MWRNCNSSEYTCMYLKFLYVYWNRLARNRKVCEVECMEQSNTLFVLLCSMHTTSHTFLLRAKRFQYTYRNFRYIHVYTHYYYIKLLYEFFIQLVACYIFLLVIQYCHETIIVSFIPFFVLVCSSLYSVSHKKKKTLH